LTYYNFKKLLAFLDGLAFASIRRLAASAVVSLSTDMWTATNGTKFMGTNVHIFDEVHVKPVVRRLSFRPFESRATTAAIKSVLKADMEDAGDAFVLSIASDGAANVRAVSRAREIERRIVEDGAHTCSGDPGNPRRQ